MGWASCSRLQRCLFPPACAQPVLISRPPVFALFIPLLLLTAVPIVGRAQGAQPPMPKTLPVPTTYEGLFAERDLRARGALQYMQCHQETMQAARSGALGEMSPSWSVACVPQGNEWRGALVEFTQQPSGSANVKVQRQWALRGAGVAVRERIDTQAVAAVARAMARGLSAPRPGRGVADLMPVALLYDSYSEVWFLPVLGASSRPVVGGDSLIQMKADGSAELGHASRTPPVRSLPAPVAGAPWTIDSREDRVPLISELIAARRGVNVASEVRVRTKQYESTLRRGGQWTHRALPGATPGATPGTTP